MKISVLLPYKENFSSTYAGAVSLQLKDTIKLSKYKDFIKIFGSTDYKIDLYTKKYINLKFKKRLFHSSTNIYLKKFLKHEIKNPSEIIEVHNRPIYVKKLKKNNNKIILFFHNDPLSIKGSKSVIDRIELLKISKKLIFISKWVKKRFFYNIPKLKKFMKKCEVIPHSINKVKVNLKKKNNLIIFVGRLNSSKGYDVFGETMIKILNKYKNWKGIVFGDEPREKIFFEHKNLKIMGFKTHNYILNQFIKSSISVVCSRWNEPFGRTALEASSRGCAVIITNRGGLPESASYGIKINNLNSRNLYIKIDKLIKNKKYREKIQKNTLSKFKYTNILISQKIDKIRNEIIKS